MYFKFELLPYFKKKLIKINKNLYHLSVTMKLFKGLPFCFPHCHQYPSLWLNHCPNGQMPEIPVCCKINKQGL